MLVLHFTHTNYGLKTTRVNCGTNISMIKVIVKMCSAQNRLNVIVENRLVT